MRTYCIRCGSHFDESCPGDDVCPRCLDSQAELERDERAKKEDEEKDKQETLGERNLNFLKGVFESWHKPITQGEKK